MSLSSVLLAILALGFLIVVHEAGHYFVARWCQMRVERFSIGFGPGVLKARAKSGTVFQLAPIPFGGFVEIRGMNIAEEIDPEDAQAYPNRPTWQRFLTILAGPATNYLSAIFIVFAVFTCNGMPGDTYFIGDVRQDYDAYGKLEINDRIVAIDGEHVYSPSSVLLSERINQKAGAAVAITVLRGYRIFTYTLTPKLVTNDKNEPVLSRDGKRQFRIGIGQVPDLVDVGLGTAARHAVMYPIEMTGVIVGGLKKMIAGKEEPDPMGPVGIVREFGAAFDRGLRDGVMLLAMLSVYLGLFNLFPLPALDGGRLVFLLYEMVTRRRANPKIETTVHLAGIMVLIVVMILVTIRDCGRF